MFTRVLEFTSLVPGLQHSETYLIQPSPRAGREMRAIRLVESHTTPSVQPVLAVTGPSGPSHKSPPRLVLSGHQGRGCNDQKPPAGPSGPAHRPLPDWFCRGIVGRGCKDQKPPSAPSRRGLLRPNITGGLLQFSWHPNPFGALENLGVAVGGAGSRPPPVLSSSL